MRCRCLIYLALMGVCLGVRFVDASVFLSKQE